jgi:hypothetical protein
VVRASYHPVGLRSSQHDIFLTGTAPDAHVARRADRAKGSGVRSSRKLGASMPIMRVSEPTFEEKEKRSENRVFVRFRVNRAPDSTWISTFKGHASSSVLRAANAVFNGNDVTLELVKPKSRAELTTALDCFIECANLGLRSWGGVERSPASSPGVLRRV